MNTFPVDSELGSYDFLLSAERAHNLVGYDFPKAFDHYFTHGYVFKTPEHFLMAGRDPTRTDAWLVWWAEIHPLLHSDFPELLRVFLAHMPYSLPYIGWARYLKGNRTVRYYSTSRLLSLRGNHAPPL